AGQINGAAGKFNGTSQYLNNLSLTITAGSSITVSYWELQTTADVQDSSIFTIGDADDPNRCSALSPWSNATLYWDYGDSASGGRVSTDFTAYLDAWTHVAVTYDSVGTTHKIYLNG